MLLLKIVFYIDQNCYQQQRKSRAMLFILCLSLLYVVTTAIAFPGKRFIKCSFWIFTTFRLGGHSAILLATFEGRSIRDSHLA